MATKSLVLKLCSLKHHLGWQMMWRIFKLLPYSGLSSFNKILLSWKRRVWFFSFNYRWYFSQENFVSIGWTIFFSGEESNKRILALHWHFKNAKNISICLDQRCHYWWIWYFRTGIFQSKSIQQNTNFISQLKNTFSKSSPNPWLKWLCPPVAVSLRSPQNSLGTGTYCGPIPGHLHSIAAGASSSTMAGNNTAPSQCSPFSSELKSSGSTEINKRKAHSEQTDVQHPLHFRTVNKRNIQHSPHNKAT